MRIRRLTGKKKEQLVINNNNNLTEQKDLSVHQQLLEDIQTQQQLIDEQINMERPSFYNEGYVTRAPKIEKSILEEITVPIEKSVVKERLSERDDYSTLFHGSYIKEKFSISYLMIK